MDSIHSDLINIPSFSNPELAPSFEREPDLNLSGDLATNRRENDLTCSVLKHLGKHPRDCALNEPQYVTLLCKNCGEWRDVPVHCQKRYCPTCMARRSDRLLDKYAGAAAAMQHPKLLTLTMPWSKNLRRGCLKLRAAFTRLRHRKPFNIIFKGCIYGFHFIPKSGGMWYIHLHALVDMKYVPQAIISRAWRAVTGNSYVVDIRKARSPKGGLKYILGYITATGHLSGYEDEVQDNLEGMRLVQTASGLFSASAPGFRCQCSVCGSSDWELIAPYKIDPHPGSGYIPPPPLGGYGNYETYPGNHRVDSHT